MDARKLLIEEDTGAMGEGIVIEDDVPASQSTFNIKNLFLGNPLFIGNLHACS